MYVRTIGPEHLGQGWGRIAIRLGSNKTARDGMMLRLGWPGAFQNSQSPLGAVRVRDTTKLAATRCRPLVNIAHIPKELMDDQ